MKMRGASGSYVGEVMGRTVKYSYVMLKAMPMIKNIMLTMILIIIHDSQ
jgi:hypothetical protein